MSAIWLGKDFTLLFYSLLKQSHANDHFNDKNIRTVISKCYKPEPEKKEIVKGNIFSVETLALTCV